MTEKWHLETTVLYRLGFSRSAFKCLFPTQLINTFSSFFSNNNWNTDWKFFSQIFFHNCCKNAILHFLQLNFLDPAYHIMTRLYPPSLCEACYFHLKGLWAEVSNFRRAWPGWQTLSSSPPTCTPKLQLFTEQLLMRMTWKLAEKIFHNLRYKEGTTERWVGRVETV